MTKWMKKAAAAACAVVLAVGLAACGSPKEDRDRENDGRSEAAATPPPTEASTEASTEAPALTSRFADVKPGDVIEFGTYSDSHFTCSQPRGSSIQWVVLENNRSEIFVVSRYVLDYLSMDLADTENGSMPGKSSLTMPKLSNPSPTKEETEKGAVTWETSTARAWLNQYFYEYAFSEEEKEYIVESRVKTENTKNPEGLTYMEDSFSPTMFKESIEIHGGNITKDFVFLPSYEEAKEYLEPLGILDAVPTKEYEKRATSDSFGIQYRLEDIRYLLRSPGKPCVQSVPKNEIGRTDGIFYSNTLRVCHGDTLETVTTTDRYKNGQVWQLPKLGAHLLNGIRPAMRIRIE